VKDRSVYNLKHLPWRDWEVIRKEEGEMMRKGERIRGKRFKRLHSDITDRMRQSKRPVCDGFERIW
jgi:hypothetical protein